MNLWGERIIDLHQQGIDATEENAEPNRPVVSQPGASPLIDNETSVDESSKGLESVQEESTVRKKVLFKFKVLLNPMITDTSVDPVILGESCSKSDLI